MAPDMLMATSGADWQWAAVFNQRIAHVPESDPGFVADPCWDRFRIRLLAKCYAPTAFRLLIPVAILKASSKLWSRCFLRGTGAVRQHPEPRSHGIQKDIRMLGVCVSVVRLLFEKRAEAGLETHVAQVGSARAYDSIPYSAPKRADALSAPGMLPSNVVAS